MKNPRTRTKDSIFRKNTGMSLEYFNGEKTFNYELRRLMMSTWDVERHKDEHKEPVEENLHVFAWADISADNSVGNPKNDFYLNLLQSDIVGRDQLSTLMSSCHETYSNGKDLKKAILPPSIAGSASGVSYLVDSLFLDNDLMYSMGSAFLVSAVVAGIWNSKHFFKESLLTKRYYTKGMDHKFYYLIPGNRRFTKNRAGETGYGVPNIATHPEFKKSENWSAKNGYYLIDTELYNAFSSLSEIDDKTMRDQSQERVLKKIGSYIYAQYKLDKFKALSSMSAEDKEYLQEKEKELVAYRKEILDMTTNEKSLTSIMEKSKVDEAFSNMHNIS